jgi:hypothetical protein
MYVFNDRVVIGDLGLTKQPDDPNLTDSEKMVGPFHDLAPEVVAGDADIDWERADVFYLATSLWRLAVEKRYPPRGQIRAHEEDSLALLIPDEPRIADLARLIQNATARTPSARPTLRELTSQLQGWIDFRVVAEEATTQHARFAATYEQEELRTFAVLRWLVNEVRTEPVFRGLWFKVEGGDTPSTDVPGLTEGQVAEAFIDLIQRGYMLGEPHWAAGGSPYPRDIWGLFPTMHAILQLGLVDDLLAASKKLLLALVPLHHGLRHVRNAERELINRGDAQLSSYEWREAMALRKRPVDASRPFTEAHTFTVPFDALDQRTGDRLLESSGP